MNICILGCGAIGGMLAAFLSEADADVTVVDRGAQFTALRDHGLLFVDANGGRWHRGDLRVADTLKDCGDFDFVFLAVKSHEIESLVDDLPRLLTEGTALVTLQNGLPWWYFQRHGGPLEGHILQSVDPGGRLSGVIDAQHIIGCVAYPAAEVTEPGVVRHIEGIRFPIGELDGRTTARAQKISDLLTGAGLKSPVLGNIREEIWLKAWGNLAFNPISALTHATMAEIARFPRTREYTSALMSEAEIVANKLGVSFRVPLERRLQGAEKVGDHKTSMLQDALALRPMEIEAILGSIIELADLVGEDVPHLAGLYALCSLRDKINQKSTDG